MPRSVPPRHWYDESLLEQGDAPGRPEPGERDRRAPAGPASPASPGASYGGTSAGYGQARYGQAGYGQEASYGPGGYPPEDPYQANDPYQGNGSYQANGSHQGNGSGDSHRRDGYDQGGYGLNDPYGRGEYVEQAPTSPVDYGQGAPNGRGPAGYYQDSSYDGGPAGYDRDARYQDARHPGNGNGAGAAYDQDGWYQPNGYDQDTQYQGHGYGQDGHYQGGPADYRQNGDYGQGPADGQRPGDDGPRTPHRHNKRGQAGKPRLPRLIRRLLSHRSVQAVLVALVIFFGWVGWSVGQALTVPGNGTVSTRLAEWARDHYLGPVVTLGEWLTYKAPKVGGKPQFSLTGPTAGTGSGTSRTGTSTFKPIVPASLTSPAGAPLPGEGQWRVLASVNGYPAIYGTYLRPDSVHTSYVAGIASMDQRLLKFQLRPGAEDPGGTGWGYSPYLPANSRSGLLATFNGGFKLDSAGGGFYLNGRSKGVLTNGAASLVYYKNGGVAIGAWGQTVSMNANVAGVRQNLKLIVSNGAVPASVDQNVQGQWGATLGGGYYVWRSGIGITRDGRIVWVYGPALSVRSLANLLQRAGAVQAMQMDINPAWMSYMYYKPTPSAANPTPVNLLPNQPEPANRYYSINSRDFTAVFAR